MGAAKLLHTRLGSTAILIAIPFPELQLLLMVKEVVVPFQSEAHLQSIIITVLARNHPAP